MDVEAAMRCNLDQQSPGQVWHIQTGAMDSDPANWTHYRCAKDMQNGDLDDGQGR